MAYTYDFNNTLNKAYITNSFVSRTFQYVVANSVVEKFSNYVYDPSNDFFQFASSLFGTTDLGKMIKSVRWYPFDIRDYFNVEQYDSSEAYIGGKLLSDVFGQYFVYYLPDTMNNNAVLMGDFDIPFYEGVDSYLSYEPYRQIKLYLPFYNELINIDGKRIKDGKLFVHGVVNFLDGDMIYILTTGGGEYIGSYKAHITIDIPIYSADITAYMGKVVNNLNQSLQAGIQQKYLEAVTHAGSQMFVRVPYNLSCEGGTDAVKGAYAPMTPTLLIYNSRIKYHLNDTRYNHLLGVPTYKTDYLKNFAGFTKVRGVHINDMGGATSTEIDEIDRLLKEGIIMANTNAKFRITYSGSNFTSSSSTTQVNWGSSFGTTITATTGYTFDSVRVFMGGQEITATAVTNNVISISAVYGTIAIYVYTHKTPVTYTITYTNLVGATLSNTATTIEEGSRYTTYIQPDYANRYILGNFVPTIKINGSVVSTTNIYSEGLLTIPNVNGNIEIIGTLPSVTNLNTNRWIPRHTFLSATPAQTILDVPNVNIYATQNTRECSFSTITFDNSIDIGFNNSFIYGDANIYGIGSNLFTGVNDQLEIVYLDTNQQQQSLGALSHITFTSSASWTTQPELLEYMDSQFINTI